MTKSCQQYRVKGNLLPWLIVVLASVCYAGFVPLAPGTAGTLVAALGSWLARGVGLGPYFYGGLVLFVFLLAWWTAGRAEKLFGQSDSPKIVIDEVAGFLVSMVAIPTTLFYLTSAVILFRIFDILKLFPSRLVLARSSGGLAVVADDVIAGIYTNLILQLVKHLSV